MENTVIKQADAVVVGGGAAGIVAAYKMAKKGLKVIMMDKGSSMLDSDFSKISGYIGCDTKYQKANDQKGHKPDDHRHAMNHQKLFHRNF